MTPLDAIKADLMKKTGADVSAAIIRTASLLPDSERLPVVMAGIASALGVGAAALAKGPRTAWPQKESVMLAALLGAHMGMETPDPIGTAYADLAFLKERIA